jgi:hypothetical protein
MSPLYCTFEELRKDLSHRYRYHFYLHAHVLPRPPHEQQSFPPPKKSVPSQSAATASICAHNEMYKCRRRFKVSRNGL